MIVEPALYLGSSRPSLASSFSLFGVLLIIPDRRRRHADGYRYLLEVSCMPAAACAATGLSLLGTVCLIIAGALAQRVFRIHSVGPSCCKAMNRSFLNVLFGAFGQVQEGGSTAMSTKPVHSAGIKDAAAIMAGARKIIVVPGYRQIWPSRRRSTSCVNLTDAPIERGVEVKICDSPRRRAHARPHECAAG